MKPCPTCGTASHYMGCDGASVEGFSNELSGHYLCPTCHKPFRGEVSFQQAKPYNQTNLLMYKTLTLGDIRQAGDEKRVLQIEGGPYAIIAGRTHTRTVSLWMKADLLGQPILASDLMHLEFRRPV